MSTTTKLSAIDMLAACCGDVSKLYGTRGHSLDKPFSIDKWAYGSDGRICLRIPVVELLFLPPAITKPPPVLTLDWNPESYDEALAVPEELPAEQHELCYCRHHMPKEDWPNCRDCKGTGEQSTDTFDRITLAPNTDISVKYARLLHRLGVTSLHPHKKNAISKQRMFMFRTNHKGAGLLVGMLPK